MPMARPMGRAIYTNVPGGALKIRPDSGTGDPVIGRRARRSRRGVHGMVFARPPGMDTVLQDVRYALRTLGRAPAFTAAAVIAIALGVGGSSAMFSVLESVALRPIAAPEPDRLVRLYELSRNGDRGSWSVPDYVDLAQENNSFEA